MAGSDQRQGRFLAKAAGYVLFGLLATGLALFSWAAKYLLDNNAFDGVDCFAKTAYAGIEAYERAVSAAEIYDESHDSLEMDMIYGENLTNVSIAIKDPQTQTIVYRNFAAELVASDDYYHYGEDDVLRYVVTYGLRKNMIVSDLFKRGDKMYSFLYAYRYLWIIGVPLLVLLLVCDVLYLLALAKGEDGTLFWLDRVPFDALTLSIALFYVWTKSKLQAYGIMSINPIDSISRQIIALAYISPLVFPLAYMSLAWLLCLARRLRAGTLWQGVLAKRLLAWVADFARGVPLVPLTILGYTAFWSLFLFFWRGYYPRRVHWIMISSAGIAIVYAAYQLKLLHKAGRNLAQGHLDEALDDRHMVGMLKEHAMDLSKIRQGVLIAVEEQMKSERLKTELITNVSHDIKTPLTSIINYVDLLQKEHTPEEEAKYLDALSRNSRRLRKLTEDIVEASKASTGNIQAELAPCHLKEMIEQAIAEYQDKLESARLEVVVVVGEPSPVAMADGRLLWRVLSNLLSNCVKYAQADTRVYIESAAIGARARISIKNISRDALNVSPDELMERFVRGEKSRTSEGSGLGLNIAKSLCEIMGGELALVIDGDLFKAMVELPVAQEQGNA